MAGPGQARFYSSTFVQTSLAAGISAGTTTFNVGTTTGAPGTPFVVSVDQNTASEELMLVTNVSGLQYTVTRGVGGTSAVTHANGASVVHVMYAQDLTDASAHIGAFDAVHGLSTGSLVVGTTDVQTLSNKTLTSPTINTPTITSPTITGTASTGPVTSTGLITAVDFAATGLTGTTAASRYVGAHAGGAPTTGSFNAGDFIVDTTNNTFLVCNTTGSPGSWSTIVNRTNPETLTNKTISSGIFTGSGTGSGSINLTNFMEATAFISSGKASGSTSSSTYAGGTASGSPATGTYALGDYVIDQTGNIWICTTAGTPGTWMPVGGGQGIMAAPTTTTSTGTASSGTTDTIDTVLGNYQFTAVSGRRYKVIHSGLLSNTSVSGDTFALRIRDSGSSSTPTTSSTAVIDVVYVAQSSGTAGDFNTHMEDTFVASSSGTHTLAFFSQRLSGTGVYTPVNSTVRGGTGRRALWVEDIGTI